jgi:hypothetical protein
VASANAVVHRGVTWVGNHTETAETGRAQETSTQRSSDKHWDTVSLVLSVRSITFALAGGASVPTGTVMCPGRYTGMYRLGSRVAGTDSDGERRFSAVA